MTLYYYETGYAYMIYSMTGFGRAELQNADRKITVEIKSVNHRYLEFNIRAPRKFNLFDASIRRVLREYAQRGKLDVFISYEDFSQSHVHLKYNEELARQYVEYAAGMSSTFSLPNDLTASRLMNCPEVLSMEEQPIDEEALWLDLEAALREAGRSFMEARHNEGEHLLADLQEKLSHLDSNVDLVVERAPAILEEYKQRLREKTRELLDDAQMDESRIAAEVILFADKICTDEETVRLKGHIRSMREALQKGDGIGRKLDFLAQDMNREANTILSKSNDMETSEIAVELKTEIEKIREQIQNIE